MQFDAMVPGVNELWADTVATDPSCGIVVTPTTLDLTPPHGPPRLSL